MAFANKYGKCSLESSLTQINIYYEGTDRLISVHLYKRKLIILPSMDLFADMNPLYRPHFSHINAFCCLLAFRLMGFQDRAGFRKRKRLFYINSKSLNKFSYKE